MCKKIPTKSFLLEIKLSEKHARRNRVYAYNYYSRKKGRDREMKTYKCSNCGQEYVIYQSPRGCCGARVEVKE
jgi:hypothetical protein